MALVDTNAIFIRRVSPDRTVPNILILLLISQKQKPPESYIPEGFTFLTWRFPLRTHHFFIILCRIIFSKYMPSFR